ncbi:MAG: hypothetical protein M1832_004873 [Thelocarpon impressellum]|nr:MAG: hypothetical protein M1832_004873 [Thelocarpon impressellum]
MTEPSDAQTFLFGGATPWTASDWTSSDDRVRGGKSESHLELLEGGASVQFHGVLDIRTLGLAGFASQRTTGDDRSWDLSTFDGIELALGEIDDNKYTLILKDSIAAGASRDGPDESTISYEYDFRLGSAQHKKLFVPWSSLKATYRGRDAKDAPKINLHNVKLSRRTKRANSQPSEDEERTLALRRTKTVTFTDLSEGDRDSVLRGQSSDEKLAGLNGSSRLAKLPLVPQADVSDSEPHEVRVNSKGQVEVFTPIGIFRSAARKSAHAWQSIPPRRRAYEPELESVRRAQEGHRRHEELLRQRRVTRKSTFGDSNEAGSSCPRRESGLSGTSSGDEDDNGWTGGEARGRARPAHEPSEEGSSNDMEEGDPSAPERKEDLGAEGRHTARRGRRRPAMRLKFRSTAETTREFAAKKKAKIEQAGLRPVDRPYPKLYALPAELREKGVLKLAKEEEGKVDWAFTKEETWRRYDRHINRTTVNGLWKKEAKAKTLDERLRMGSPSPSPTPDREWLDELFEEAEGEPEPGPSPTGSEVYARRAGNPRVTGRGSGGGKDLPSQVDDERPQRQTTPARPASGSGRSSTSAHRKGGRRRRAKQRLLQQRRREEAPQAPTFPQAPPSPRHTSNANWREEYLPEFMRIAEEEDPYARFL